MTERRTFDDLMVGEVFRNPSRTVTDAHFAAFQVISETITQFTTISSSAARMATAIYLRMASRSSPSVLPARAVFRT